MSNTNTNVAKSEWEEKELGALWSKQKQGTSDTYYSGKINLKSVGFDKDIKVVVFPNRNKTSDAQPDLKIYISKPSNKSESTLKNTSVKPVKSEISNVEKKQSITSKEAPEVEQQDDGTLF
jgi:hypothetical protein